jgi:hypothetical protein
MRFLNKLHLVLYSRNVLRLKGIPRNKFVGESTIMFEAMFQVLVNYVKNECARMELLSCSRYSKFDIFLHRWIPFFFSDERKEQLGLRYLEWASSLGEQSPDQSKYSKIIIDLYLWYTREYPMMLDPYEVEPEPERLFVDRDGNPTRSMIDEEMSSSGNFKMNRFHESYVEYLNRCSAIEEEQYNIVNQKLKELLEVRNHFY